MSHYVEIYVIVKQCYISNLTYNFAIHTTNLSLSLHTGDSTYSHRVIVKLFSLFAEEMKVARPSTPEVGIPHGSGYRVLEDPIADAF